MYFDIILPYAVQKIKEKRKVTYCISTRPLPLPNDGGDGDYIVDKSCSVSQP